MRSVVALIYLLLSVVRFFATALDRSHRKLVLFCRVGVSLLAVVISPLAQVCVAMIHANAVLGSLVEVVFVIAIGEHLIFNYLEKLGALPTGSPRVPLGI